ncbi:MAG TPA: anthranilate synthase component I, partial [Desulfobacteraceae bacterium]|nr:anthranilate synthase component I [Desulfobacteraceae bacterium]
MILEQLPDKDTFVELAKTANVIPVATRVLADTDTPVSILQKCYDRDRECFLLESVEGGERWARFSFLGVSAFGHIKVYGDHVEVATRRKTEKIPHNNDPLGVMREVVQRYTPANIKDLPRFWSGVTGYFTYEVVSFFEDIPVCLPEGTPYGHFIIPEQMIIFDNIQQTLTCLNICYLEPGADAAGVYDTARKDLDKLVADIRKPVAQEETKACAQVELCPITPAEEYKAGVRRIKEHIVEGDIFQA